MLVGRGVDLFDVARMKAEFRNADPVFTRQLFAHDQRPILLQIARTRGVPFASGVPESSP